MIFYFNDYEHARKYLKVLIKPDNFVPKEMSRKLVTKSHFPGTLTALVFHHNRQFRFLCKDDIKEWNISSDELFAEALENIKKEEILVEPKGFENGRKIYAIMSNEYSATALINIEKRFPHFIGKSGTIFSIPSNGTAFAMPLNDGSDLEKLFRSLLAVTAMAYKQEPSPITFDLFHYYNGGVNSMVEVLRTAYPEIYKLAVQVI